LLGWWLPAAPFEPWLRWLGLPLVVAGAGVAIAGSRLFARAGTSIIPLSQSSALVTDGVFRYSRNPMYVGMIATLGGAALLVHSLWGWLVVAAFAWLIRRSFVLREEALLRQTFGEAYAQYCGRVRRWL